MPSTNDDVTLGELARNMERWRSEFHIEITALATAIQNLQVVRPDVYEANRVADALLTAAQDTRIEKLEERNQWLSRVVAVAMISALCSFLATGALFIITKGS